MCVAEICFSGVFSSLGGDLLLGEVCSFLMIGSGFVGVFIFFNFGGDLIFGGLGLVRIIGP